MEAPTVPRFIGSHRTPEFFSGSIGQKKASQLEERFAKFLKERGVDFSFQMRILPNGNITEKKSNLPGEVEIDFLAIWYGLIRPVQIDGEIGHYKMPWQIELDKEKDARVNQVLKHYGAWPIIRIPYWKIWTPEQTRRLVREIFT